MSQKLELYRGLRDESLWTPDIVYDVAPPNTLVREGYDYGEGTDGYDQEATRGSLIDGVVDFFSKLFGDLGDIFGGAIEAGVGFLNHVATGVINLVEGIANGIRGIFGGTTTEWEEDPNHVFAPVTESLEEAVLPILEKAEEGVERAGEANQRIIDLGDEFDAKVGEQGEITQSIESINAEMARQFAEDGLLQQEFDAVRSDLSSATSGLSDDIYNLGMASGAAYQSLNTQLWGEQGELNRINDELWGAQSALNTTLSDFREMQLEWNDNTTGWIKKQEDIQNLNDEFRDEQSKVNDEIQDILSLLKAAQEKQIDTSFRTLTPYMNGGEDEYVRILPTGGVRAKGGWVGHIVYTTAPRTVSRETERASFSENHQHPYIDSVSETYSDSVPSQSGSRTYGTESVSVVQYLPSPGIQKEVQSVRTAFTPGTSWTKLLGFPVDSPGDHIVNARVHWSAADRGTYYGVEIGVMRSGNWRSIKRWESNELGPTFPWQDGKRTTTILASFDISNTEATSRAEIQLRAYSSGNSSQRHTSGSSMEIVYIEQQTA